MSSTSSIEKDSQQQQQTPQRRPTINAAMARKLSVLNNKNEQSSSPIRRVSVVFFKAQKLAKAKNMFVSLLRNNSADSSTPSTPGLWDPKKESRMVYILKKERKSRKDAEVINQTIKNFAFYNQFIENNMTEFGDEAVLQLCRQMKYEFIRKGRYVMKEGDASDDKFYIILSGKASVLLNKDVNVYAKQNIEELKKQDDEEQLHVHRSHGRLKTSQISKISKFSGQRNDDQEVPQNRESATTKPSLFNTKIGGSPSRLTLEGADNSEDSNNSELKSLNIPTNNQGESSYVSHIQGRKGLKKLTMQAAKSGFLRRALGEDENKGSDAEFDLNEFGTVNKILEEGTSFGEKALTNPGAKRTASIFTVTDCEFIIIHKKDFLTIFNRFNKTNEQKLEFLISTIPNLDKVNSRLILEDYMYSLHISDSAKGHKLTEQGRSGERIYFVSNGFCTIQKEVVIPNPHPEKNILLKQKMTVQIAKVGPNTIIGDEILFGNRKEKKYNYTITVDSNGALIYYMKASELQLKFPKDALQALKENFQQKELYHQKRIDFLTQQKQENPDFYTEYDSLSVRNIFENLRPSSQSECLIRAVKTKEIDRNQTAVDQDEKERLMNLRSEISAFCRDPDHFRSQLQLRNNQTLEHYYLHLRASQQENEIAQIDSPKLGFDKNTSFEGSDEDDAASQITTENLENDGVFELTTLGYSREKGKEESNNETSTFSSVPTLKKASSHARMLTAMSESKDQEKILSPSPGTNAIISNRKDLIDKREQKPRRRMAIRSVEQLPIVNLKEPILEIETHNIAIKINAPNTERQIGRRSVKFHSTNDGSSLKPVLPNESSSVLNFMQTVEAELPSPKLHKQINTKSALRSASARTARELRTDIHKYSMRMPSGPRELPNKRHYIIRQKEGSKTDSNIMKHREINDLKFEQIMDENLKSFGEDGLKKFNFASNRGYEAALDTKKKVLLRRMLEQKGIIALEDKAAAVHPGNLASTSSFFPLNTLRSLVTPRKDGFQHKIAATVSLVLNLKKGASLNASKQGTGNNNLNVKEIEVDTPMNIQSYQTTARNGGFGTHTRASTFTDTKSSTSGSFWNSSMQRKFVTENLTTRHLSGSKELASSNSKNDNLSRDSQVFFRNNDRRLHASHNRSTKSGAGLSLYIKKGIHDALRANKTRASWKTNFGNTNSISSINQNLSKDILEVKTLIYEQSQETQTENHR